MDPKAEALYCSLWKTQLLASELRTTLCRKSNSDVVFMSRVSQFVR